MLKIINKFVFVAFFFLLSFSKAYAQNSESTSALEALSKNVKFIKLSNGLRVLLYNRGVAPVFSGMVAVRVGGVDEQLGQTGISHMLEHMAFKGTKTIGTSDYTREAKLLDEYEELVLRERNGIRLNDSDLSRKEQIDKELKELWIVGDLSSQYDRRGAVDMNASTDKELTRYFVDMPKSGFEFWCWMESERIVAPIMRQFYQERDVVMEERRMRFEDDPGGKLYEMLLGVAYLSHPYRNPVIGYDFDIKNLTASMVANYHKDYYVASNIVVSVVGEIDTEKDIKIIEKYFGRIPNGEAPKHPSIIEAKQLGERKIILEAKAAPLLYVAYHKPNYPNPDDPPLSLMSQILAGGRVAPLYDILVKKKRLAASVSHTEGPGSAYPNLSIFSAELASPHTTADLLAAFDSEIAKFIENGPTQEQLDIAKRAVAMSYLSHLKSNSSLADDLATSELIYGDWSTSLKWFNEMSKVSIYDVQRVARDYLIKSNRIVAILETEKPKQKNTIKGTQ